MPYDPKQIVNRWLKGSEDAWDTAEKLMAAKNLTILFFYSSSIGENHQGRLYQKNNSLHP